MREYPIKKLWYTRYSGHTIEQLIDKNPGYFVWMVTSFQNVTPAQAKYFTRKTGKVLNKMFIQDVEPYEWQKGDPDGLYMELCDTQDLKGTLEKYRKAPDPELFSF